MKFMYTFVSIIVLFCSRNGKIASAKFSPICNLPQLTANCIICQEKSLFSPFLKTSGSESQHHPFLSLPHNSFKAPSLF